MKVGDLVKCKYWSHLAVVLEVRTVKGYHAIKLWDAGGTQTWYPAREYEVISD